MCVCCSKRTQEKKRKERGRQCKTQEASVIDKEHFLCCNGCGNRLCFRCVTCFQNALHKKFRDPDQLSDLAWKFLENWHPQADLLQQHASRGETGGILIPHSFAHCCWLQSSVCSIYQSEVLHPFAGHIMLLEFELGSATLMFLPMFVGVLTILDGNKFGLFRRR